MKVELSTDSVEIENRTYFERAKYFTPVVAIRTIKSVAE